MHGPEVLIMSQMFLETECSLPLQMWAVIMKGWMGSHGELECEQKWLWRKQMLFIHNVHALALRDAGERECWVKCVCVCVVGGSVRGRDGPLGNLVLFDQQRAAGSRASLRP